MQRRRKYEPRLRHIPQWRRICRDRTDSLEFREDDRRLMPQRMTRGYCEPCDRIYIWPRYLEWRDKKRGVATGALHKAWCPECGAKLKSLRKRLVERLLATWGQRGVAERVVMDGHHYARPEIRED